MARSVTENGELDRVQHLTEILHEAALRLNRHQDIEQLLHDVLDLSQDALQADSCLVYLYEGRSNDLVLRASSNSHPNEVGRLHIRLGEGITGWVAQQRRPVAISKDAINDSRFKFYASLPEDRYEAFLSVPVLNRNVVLGVINLQHRNEHVHDPLEIKTVVALGLMLGEALDRSIQVAERTVMQKRLDDCSRLTELLRTGVVANQTRIAEQLRASAGAVEAYLLLNDEGASVCALPPEKITSYLERAKNTSPTIDSETELIVGLKYGTTNAGCVVCKFERPSDLSDERIRFISLLANWVSTALEMEALRKRCHEYESALAARKVIERAKGILQRERNISEDEAYRLLQSESRRNRRPMVAVAEALLTSRAIASTAAENNRDFAG